MSLSAAAQAVHGRLYGADVAFTGVSTDTRTTKSGDLFVALTGPNFDGHNFIAQAANAGAVGAFVDHALDAALPQVQVDDTRLALGRLATAWRQRFAIPVVAVTGSNGKTTVKNMIAAILAERGPTLATIGNLNNDIGVPLTLLRLRESDRYAVIEMGMNHAGEIDYLTHLARPTVALVNNAAAAHLAGLGSIEAVARAKGEIFNGLDADGTAIINADDPHAVLWRGLAGAHRILSFGMEQPADITATCSLDDGGSTLQLQTPYGGITMRLPLLGRHNAMNALAASSAALAAGASLADIQAGLEKLKAVSGRLEVKPGAQGARVLDDSYNANPGSLTAGIEVLRAASGERVLVFGDMGELGDTAAALHQRIGELAKKVGIEHLFAVGPLSREAVMAFGEGAMHFDSHEELVAALRPIMHASMTVLVKGSRSMKMERIVAGITESVAGAA